MVGLVEYILLMAQIIKQNSSAKSLRLRSAVSRRCYCSKDLRFLSAPQLLGRQVGCLQSIHSRECRRWLSEGSRSDLLEVLMKVIWRESPLGGFITCSGANRSLNDLVPRLSGPATDPKSSSGGITEKYSTGSTSELLTTDLLSSPSNGVRGTMGSLSTCSW